jgi:hypothetical protein
MDNPRIKRPMDNKDTTSGELPVYRCDEDSLLPHF